MSKEARRMTAYGVKEEEAKKIAEVETREFTRVDPPKEAPKSEKTAKELREAAEKLLAEAEAKEKAEIEEKERIEAELKAKAELEKARSRRRLYFTHNEDGCIDFEHPFYKAVEAKFYDEDYVVIPCKVDENGRYLRPLRKEEVFG